MQFHSHANQSHFHKNGFVLRLALKQRHRGTRKWPIRQYKILNIKKKYRRKKICLNSKRVKNVRTQVSYMQNINRLDRVGLSVKKVQFALVVKYKCMFLILLEQYPKVQMIQKRKRRSHRVICFWPLNLETNLVLWICISEAPIMVLWNIVGMIVDPFRI